MSTVLAINSIANTLSFLSSHSLLQELIFTECQKLCKREWDSTKNNVLINVRECCTWYYLWCCDSKVADITVGAYARVLEPGKQANMAEPITLYIYYRRPHFTLLDANANRKLVKSPITITIKFQLPKIAILF